QAARLIGLKGWGGLVAVDLVGVGHDGAAMLAAARAAFGSDPEIVFGPVNRFGVLMLSLPWRTSPVETRLWGPDGRPTLETRALDAVRRLRLALAEDTASPYLTLRGPPAVAAVAGPLAARLGPRARVKADPALPAGVESDEGRSDGALSHLPAGAGGREILAVLLQALRRRGPAALVHGLLRHSRPARGRPGAG